MSENEKTKKIKVLNAQKKAFEDLIDILACSLLEAGFEETESALAIEDIEQAANQLMKIYSSTNTKLN